MLEAPTVKSDLGDDVDPIHGLTRGHPGGDGQRPTGEGAAALPLLLRLLGRSR